MGVLVLPQLIIAATGHRPDKLGGYNSFVTRELQRLAEKELFARKPNTVITGMALGWDQAVGWAAKSLKIPFHAYIPFAGQELKWPPASQDAYRELLSYAGEIVVCSPGGYEARKMHIRNERMVDVCDELLALWNGTAGGTASCIAYARKRGRPVHNCWQAWVKF